MQEKEGGVWLEGRKKKWEGEEEEGMPGGSGGIRG